MDNIKIILLCGSRFALPALKEFVFFGQLGAVAIPRRSDEWLENVQVVLTGTGIPVIELEKETFELKIREAIEEHQINLGLVMTFPYKIPPAIYKLPEKGFYNVHPGPLPQYRGADPVFQQIVNREKFAGVTLHQLDEGMDTGSVVMGEMLKIEQSDTYGLLNSKLALLSAKLTRTLTKLIGLDLAIPSRLQDETKARYFKRQGVADIVINWQTMDADSIIALINACNPWNKGAVARMNNQVIRMLIAEKLPGNSFGNQQPGTILSIEEKGLIVSTIGEGAICVKIVYVDEGYLPAHFLTRMGVAQGNCFE